MYIDNVVYIVLKMIYYKCIRIERRDFIMNERNDGRDLCDTRLVIVESRDDSSRSGDESNSDTNS